LERPTPVIVKVPVPSSFSSFSLFFLYFPHLLPSSRPPSTFFLSAPYSSLIWVTQTFAFIYYLFSCPFSFFSLFFTSPILIGPPSILSQRHHSPFSLILTSLFWITPCYPHSCPSLLPHPFRLYLSAFSDDLIGPSTSAHFFHMHHRPLPFRFLIPF
jgi:hypothetical protein